MKLWLVPCAVCSLPTCYMRTCTHGERNARNGSKSALSVNRQPHALSSAKKCPPTDRRHRHDGKQASKQVATQISGCRPSRPRADRAPAKFAGPRTFGLRRRVVARCRPLELPHYITCELHGAANIASHEAGKLVSDSDTVRAKRAHRRTAHCHGNAWNRATHEEPPDQFGT